VLRLFLEIRDIWRPGAGLAGTRDSVAQIRDIPGNPGRVATLTLAVSLASDVVVTYWQLFVYIGWSGAPRLVDSYVNMASFSSDGSRNVANSDPRLSHKRHNSSMSKLDEKVVEIDTLRAFTIPKMKKAKHGLLRRILWSSGFADWYL